MIPNSEVRIPHSAGYLDGAETFGPLLLAAVIIGIVAIVLRFLDGGGNGKGGWR